MAELNDRIVPLDELSDFEVAEGNPDVRGWEVYASDGQKIGAVDQLLVDTDALKVRYLDVDLDDSLVAQGENEQTSNQERHILIPIGYARLDESDDQIFVDELSSAQIRTLPAYGHEPLTRDYEVDLRQRFDRDYPAAGAAQAGTTAAATAAAAGDFYAHDLYDEERFYNARRNEPREERLEGRMNEGERRVTLSEEELAVGRREVAAGEVEIEKAVETRHVRESVPTRHEEVIVEHRAAEPGMNAQPRIEGEEIHIPITEEEVVAEKRVVPREELVVRKQEVVENEPIEADLRREHAEVRREGDVDVREQMRTEGRPEERRDERGL